MPWPAEVQHCEFSLSQVFFQWRVANLFSRMERLLVLSVFQECNPHDLVRDMRAEYIGYEHNLSLVKDLVRDPQSLSAYLPGRSLWAFELYRRHFNHG